MPAELGKMLLVAGLLLAAVGALIWLGPGGSWLGRLPGDIRIERPGFSLHLPLGTCLLLSLLLSLGLWLLSKLR